VIFFVGGCLQSDSRDEEALYRKTWTVLSVHLLLHKDSRIRSRRIRHAELFKVSPPSVHQMVVTLEANGFIERVPGRGRLLIPREELPDLE
jgi:Mn-dependent DtxR family transcriptional regulator